MEAIRNEKGVMVQCQGGLVKVRVSGRLPSGGGRRGVIVGFSRAARLRLIERHARLVYTGAWFVTLTYADPVPTMPQVARDLEVFWKRLGRAFPGAAAVWRKGLDSSGGRSVNPHVHLIAWGCGGLTRQWVLDTWRDVTGHPDTTQVDVQPVENRRQVARYVARYSSKDESGASLDYVAYSAVNGSVGRFWGVYNRRGVPLAVLVEVVLPWGQAFYRLKRSARVVWRGVNGLAACGFRLFVEDAGAWADLAIWYASGGVRSRADTWGAEYVVVHLQEA